MATITDFDEWLNCVDPEGHEEVYCLYKSVEDCDDLGMYSTSENDGKLFVKGPACDDTLMLASDKAKDMFLKILTKRYCDDGMDMESWYGYMCSMNNPNA